MKLFIPAPPLLHRRRDVVFVGMSMAVGIHTGRPRLLRRPEAPVLSMDHRPISHIEVGRKAAMSIADYLDAMAPVEVVIHRDASST